MKLEYLIFELKKIKCAKSFAIFLRALTNFLELRYYWYMLIPSTFFQTGQYFFISSNYPKEAAQGYIKNKFYLSDPIITHHKHVVDQHSLWTELFSKDTLTDDQNIGMEFASQFHITAGILCPIVYFDGMFSLLHFVVNPTKQVEIIKKMKTLFAGLFPLIHCKARLLFNHEYLSLSSRLTARETECLLWASKGKTDYEIANLLGISNITFRRYTQSVFHKLNTSTKEDAINKDILYKQINLSDWLL